MSKKCSWWGHQGPFAFQTREAPAPEAPPGWQCRSYSREWCKCLTCGDEWELELDQF